MGRPDPESVGGEMRTIQDLQTLQALPLDVKVMKTKQRIREWVNEYGLDGVYVSFSGGKDSTVLLTIARQMYPDIKAVFVNTGLEYPEIVQFVKTFDNVEILRPKMTFKKVIEKYGYPFISKELSAIIGGGQKALDILKSEGVDTSDRSEVVRQCAERIHKQPGEWRRLAQCYTAITKENKVKEHLTSDEKGAYSSIPDKYKFLLDAPFRISDKCCYEMKKSVVHRYASQEGRKAITAQMASESQLRTKAWLKDGCNGFDQKYPVSNPMAFWVEQDVLLYIAKNGIKIAQPYGEVVRDYEANGEIEGQMSFSDLGGEWELFDIKNPTLKTTGQRRTGCVFCGYGCQLEKPGRGRFEQLKKTNPKLYNYVFKPWDEGGLGYKEVIDWINEHGNLNIKY